jgi:hypothetical protein
LRPCLLAVDLERVAKLRIHAIAVVVLAEEAELRTIEHVDPENETPVSLEIPRDARAYKTVASLQRRDPQNFCFNALR